MHNRGFKSFHFETDDTRQFSVENFLTAEIWGRWAVTPKWQLLIFSPLQYNTRDIGHHEQKLLGIGDISLFVNCFVFNTEDSTGSLYKHALQVGVGAKLPTSILNPPNDAPRAMQPGSASFDIPVLVNYIARVNNINLLAEASYRFNTSTADGYRYANRFGGSVRLINRWRHNDWLFMPGTGLMAEYNRSDTNRTVILTGTEAKAVWAHLGLDIYYSAYTASVGWQYPVAYRMGSIKPHMRFSLGLARLF